MVWGLRLWMISWSKRDMWGLWNWGFVDDFFARRGSHSEMDPKVDAYVRSVTRIISM